MLKGFLKWWEFIKCNKDYHYCAVIYYHLSLKSWNWFSYFCTNLRDFESFERYKKCDKCVLPELYSSHTSISFPSSNNSTSEMETNEVDVDAHIKKERKEKTKFKSSSYKCQFCEKSFPRLGYLKKHEQVSEAWVTSNSVNFSFNFRKFQVVGFSAASPKFMCDLIHAPPLYSKMRCISPIKNISRGGHISIAHE